MIVNGPTTYGVPFDMLFLLVATAVNVAVAAKLYPRVAF
jgi:hypothetical protein